MLYFARMSPATTSTRHDVSLEAYPVNIKYPPYIEKLYSTRVQQIHVRVESRDGYTLQLPRETMQTDDQKARIHFPALTELTGAGLHSPKTSRADKYAQS